MTVTEFSRTTSAALQTTWAEWPTPLPNAVYRFQTSTSPLTGSPIDAGEALHECYQDYRAKKWVTKEYYRACQTIDLALSDMNIDHNTLEIESPIRTKGLSGQIDIKGKTKAGRHVVVELKTTLGQYALNPRPQELIQLVTYSQMLNIKNPLLVCLRIALNRGTLSAFTSKLSHKEIAPAQIAIAQLCQNCAT